MDSQFLKRVYRTSAAVWVFAVLWCAALRSLPAALGVTIGFAIGLGSLYGLELAVERTLRASGASGGRWAIRKFAVLELAKYGMVGVLIWLGLRSDSVSLPALVVGIGLPQAVIFLKAVGILASPGKPVRWRE